MENKSPVNSNTFMLILISILIVSLVVAITVLVNNKNAIMTDPIHYGMKQNYFYQCICQSDFDKTITFNKTSAISMPNKNYTELITIKLK
jgi:hypothetical protein